MRNDTRLHFNGYLERIATLNGVTDATKAFNVVPAVQQTLETKIQESSEFLTKINMIGVTEQQGEKLGLNLSGPIASRRNGTARRAICPRSTRTATTAGIRISIRSSNMRSSTPGQSSPTLRPASVTC